MTVAVVLDHEYGDQLGPLAATCPVWAVQSATNRHAAEELWRRDPALSITTFLYDPAQQAARTLADVLPIVEEHHGQHSAAVEWGRLLVVGARANTATRRAVASIGFDIVEETADGFTAARRAAG